MVCFVPHFFYTETGSFQFSLVTSNVFLAFVAKVIDVCTSGLKVYESLLPDVEWLDPGGGGGGVLN